MPRIARWRRLPACLALAALYACGGGGSGGEIGPPPPPPPPLTTGPAACEAGHAGDFPCGGVSLHRRVSPDAMGGTRGNDIWGWTDPVSGAEIALVGLNNGTAFVDVTDPDEPRVLGRLPTHTVPSSLRDIKVYADHAYIVADGAGAHGMQVFDLTRLRDAIPPQVFSADINYGEFMHAHNVAINEESGFAYAVGTETCGGGLHIIDIRTPNNPMFAGCHDEDYTHDTQCVIYQGPDAEHAGAEICASSNENRVAIVDVTDKSAPLTLAELDYPQRGYVHQGWLTEDHRFFLLGDEDDEYRFGVPTRTHVFDVSDLDVPVYLYFYEADTPATDHNLYVLGNRVFQANYRAGLRVLEFGDLANGEIEEIAYFDTQPPDDDGWLTGAWSVYPYFPSGVIVVSDTENGLFVLSLNAQ
ncbi:MAG TPA: choice-of-anchor B family protein [Gammaproteobacteria bacterium]|nr:choice-of-anchor B family protein [Gammaproteobacteria bacterium]